MDEPRQLYERPEAISEDRMKYDVVVEFDPVTRRFAASVAGLPVFVDGRTEEEAVRLAREGIDFYFAEGGKAESQASAKVVTVDV